MLRNLAPSPLDIQISTAIRTRRALIGMSQSELGKRIGVTFQQIQKYESGRNRVAASRLATIADALSVPFAYFFASQPISIDAHESKSLVDMANLYRQLDDKRRQLVRDFIRTLVVATTAG